MTNREKKHQCPYCPALVRQIGKHLVQKHPDQPQVRVEPVK